MYIPNAIGFVTGVFWVAVYPSYMKTKEDMKSSAAAASSSSEADNSSTTPDYYREWLMQCGGGTILGVIFALMLLFCSMAGWPAAYIGVTSFMGWFGMAVGTSMMAAPAFVMVEVVKTGNLNAMGSLVMNLVTLACGTAWFCNGFFYMNSAPVWIQNGIGTTVGAVALGIRVYVLVYSEKSYLKTRDEKYGKALAGVTSVFDTILGKPRGAVDGQGSGDLTEMNKLNTADADAVERGASVNKNNTVSNGANAADKDSDGAESRSGLITPDHK